MKNKVHKTSIDHILPKYAGGTNNNINKQRIRDVKHRAKHILFGPANVPEQIEMVLHYSIQILQESFIERVLDTLEEDPKYIYKNGVYTPRKYKKDTMKK